MGIINIQMEESLYESLMAGGTSSGGGGGSTSGSLMEYFVYDKNNIHSMSLAQIANYFKFSDVDGKGIAPYTPALKSMIEQQGKEYIAFGVPMGSKFKIEYGDNVVDTTLREYILSTGGISEEELASIPRLTEEEFYTL